MDTARSDALVFFGATGDLAYKKIFPALQAMLKRGDAPSCIRMVPSPLNFPEMTDVFDFGTNANATGP